MLVLENVQLSFNGKPVVNDLNLEVREGEIHGVLGENGTGKTTLGYLIMGANGYKPTRGRILFDGTDISGMSITERARRGISLGWQEPARFEGLKIRDYLKLGARRANWGIENYLRMVGLEPEDYLDRDIDQKLSGGERKRVELASMLALQPRLAILDEPDSGIDIVSLPLLLSAIVGMNRRGSAVLLITHNEQVAGIAHRVSVLCAGKVLRCGTPVEMCAWFRSHCARCVHINEPSEGGEGL